MKIKAGFFINGLIGVVVISALAVGIAGCRKPDGPRKEYYASGQIKSEVSHKNGKLTGICKWYLENGQLQSEEIYVNGQREGLCKWYYENGQLKSEEIWRNGVVESAKEYDESGALKS